jgi:hypothetical protein
MRFSGTAVRPGWLALALASFSIAHLSAGAGGLLSQVPDPSGPGGEPAPGTDDPPGIPDIYGSLGLNLAAAFPFGEFAENVDFGLGLTGDISFRLVESGWLGVRIDGGAIWYGHETSRSTFWYNRVPVPVESTTENYIVFGAIGPQLHFHGLPMSARVYGLVGASYFETRTFASIDADDPDDGEVNLRSVAHLSDWTPSFAIGGELRWLIAGYRDGELLGLALNLDWRRHGTTQYLVEGSIEDADAHAVFEPLESRTDFLLVSFGVWFGTW